MYFNSLLILNEKEKVITSLSKKRRKAKCIMRELIFPFFFFFSFSFSFFFSCVLDSSPIALRLNVRIDGWKHRDQSRTPASILLMNYHSIMDEKKR